MLLASDPLPGPCFPPSANIGNRPCDCAIDTAARKPPHHLAGRAGWLPPPAFPQVQFVSFGPRYPSGRILQCDASVASEVVLAVHFLHPNRHLARLGSHVEVKASALDARGLRLAPPIFFG